METFNLEGHPHVELCDLLKLQGWSESGAAAKSAIAALPTDLGDLPARPDVPWREIDGVVVPSPFQSTATMLVPDHCWVPSTDDRLIIGWYARLNCGRFCASFDARLMYRFIVVIW